MCLLKNMVEILKVNWSLLVIIGEFSRLDTNQILNRAVLQTWKNNQIDEHNIWRVWSNWAPVYNNGLCSYWNHKYMIRRNREWSLERYQGLVNSGELKTPFLLCSFLQAQLRINRYRYAALRFKYFKTKISFEHC